MTLGTGQILGAQIVTFSARVQSPRRCLTGGPLRFVHQGPRARCRVPLL